MTLVEQANSLTLLNCLVKGENRAMLTRYLSLLSGLLVLGMAITLHAASDASFPTGWENWPVTKSGAIPSNQTLIPADAPPIVKETVKTYNWIQDGKGAFGNSYVARNRS